MRPWAAVKAILAEAVDRPPSDRLAFVDRACSGDVELRAEVLGFLQREDEAARLLESGRWAGDDLDPDRPEESATGTLVGPYRLVREIGHGGMGTVYLAERADDEFRRTVAVKLLRRGATNAELVRRFRSERQILAAIDHPYITKLYDGGTTDDGRPYLVMEHVDGTPIDAYCDEKRLTIGDRLRLFTKVCSAVQLAHQHLVIHRDLKPANILVTPDGQPRLLDFGIAKLIGSRSLLEEAGDTQFGSPPMTPEYASPEQARGAPVTTASDVYSLGVLLYLLLTGRRPYTIPRGDLPEMVHLIAVQEPLRPSVVVRDRSGEGRASVAEVAARRGTSVEQLGRDLRGDLDTIVLKALRKEPARRYALVEALSQDIERHLDRRPVQARPDTLRYRATRFVQRHRGSVSVGAAATLVLLGFSAFTLRARDRAELEAAKATAINEFLQRMVGSANAGAAGGNEEVTVREMLDAAAAQVGGSFLGRPEIEAAVRETIGATYMYMGRYGPAEEQLVAARDLRLTGLGLRHPDTAKSLYLLGTLSYQRGHYDEARTTLTEAVALSRELLGERHVDVARTLHLLGIIAQDSGDDTAAEGLYREAIDIYRWAPGGPHSRLGLGLSDLASLHHDRGETEQAGSLYREAVAFLRARNHPALVQTMDFFAVHLIAGGNLDEAERVLTEENGLLEARYGERSLEIARSLGTWGRLLQARGELGEAADRQRASFEMFAAILGPAHIETAHAQARYGESLLVAGNADGARQHLLPALAIQSRTLGPDHPDTKRTGGLVSKLDAPLAAR
jgi:serine/threonine-protein kinase